MVAATPSGWGAVGCGPMVETMGFVPCPFQGPGGRKDEGMEGGAWGLVVRCDGWGRLCSTTRVKPRPFRAESSLRTPGGASSRPTAGRGEAGV